LQILSVADFLTFTPAVMESSSSKGGKETIKLVRKKKRPRKHPLAPQKPYPAFIHFSRHMHHEKKVPLDTLNKQEKMVKLINPNA
jgi:hypothetical protein